MANNLWWLLALLIWHLCTKHKHLTSHALSFSHLHISRGCIYVLIMYLWSCVRTSLQYTVPLCWCVGYMTWSLIANWYLHSCSVWSRSDYTIAQWVMTWQLSISVKPYIIYKTNNQQQFPPLVPYAATIHPICCNNTFLVLIYLQCCIIPIRHVCFCILFFFSRISAYIGNICACSPFISSFSSKNKSGCLVSKDSLRSCGPFAFRLQLLWSPALREPLRVHWP